MTLFTGCGSPAATADLSYTQKEIDTTLLPADIKVVGLGEASHGVKQYQQMKEEVFQALVKNNGCRTFIIEGDFGGALKVNEYIHGGSGTAEDAVSEIGFAIYRTQEMADLVDWMRSYNDSVPEEEKLYFYGMDAQRYDNNKEYVFSVLDQIDPELSEEYKEAFLALTDEKRTSLDDNTLKKGKEDALALITEMDAIENDIVEQSGQEVFDYARECVNSIYSCCHILLSSSYNETRDQLMYQKVEWFMEHGDESVLFINGHNGHIGKTSVSEYTCLGELLSANLGDAYYAIGTDAKETEFNSQKNNGGFEILEVKVSNDLNCQFTNSADNQYFIDFNTIEDDTWKEIINSEQKITTLNVSLSGMQQIITAFFTTKIIPEKTFDGMIVFHKVSPTTIIE